MDTNPGYETRDINTKGIFLFGGGLLGVIVIILLVVFGLFKGMQHVNRALGSDPTGSLVQTAPNYDGPLMQVTPEEDLRWMKTQNAAALDSYGWMDRANGVVQLPIDRAIDLLAERGLPPVSPGLTIEALQRQRAQPQQFGQALRP